MEEGKIRKNSYGTLYKINQPVYVVGLKPLQWIIILSVLFAAVMGLKWFSIFIVVPIIWGISKVYKENEKGTPDFIESYFFIWMGMKKKFIDRSGVMNILLKNGRRN